MVNSGMNLPIRAIHAKTRHAKPQRSIFRAKPLVVSSETGAVSRENVAATKHARGSPLTAPVEALRARILPFGQDDEAAAK